MSFLGSLFNTPSPPPVVNPYQVINAQQTASQNAANNAAFLNNVNQKTPTGTLTYNLLDGVYDYGGNWVPRFEAETKLSPEQQALYDKQVQVTQGAYDLAGNYLNRVGDATSQPYSTAGAPAAPNVPQYASNAQIPTYSNSATLGNYDQGYRNDVYSKILERAQPLQQRDRMALETRLANQGISLGTEAYRSGMDDYNRGVNDFRLGADIQSGQDAALQYQTEIAGFNAKNNRSLQDFNVGQAQFGMNQAKSLQDFNAGSAMFGMGTDARKNYLTEQQMLRMQPISEIAALMGTGGGQQYPSFVPTNNYQVQAADANGAFATSAAQQNAAYQAQLQSQAAGWGGLASLAGSLGGGYLFGLGRK